MFSTRQLFFSSLSLSRLFYSTYLRNLAPSFGGKKKLEFFPPTLHFGAFALPSSSSSSLVTFFFPLMQFSAINRPYRKRGRSMLCKSEEAQKNVSCRRPISNKLPLSSLQASSSLRSIRGPCKSAYLPSTICCFSMSLAC